VCETTSGRVAIGERVVDGLARRVREIDEHALRFHPPDHLASEVRESALVLAVGRPAERRVEEMRRSHHADAGLVEDVDVVEVVPPAHARPRHRDIPP
jgi:hypothetical protein